MAQINLNEQARQILKIAEEYGVEQNFFLHKNIQKIPGSNRDFDRARSLRWLRRTNDVC